MIRLPLLDDLALIGARMVVVAFVVVVVGAGVVVVVVVVVVGTVVVVVVVVVDLVGITILSAPADLNILSIPRPKLPEGDHICWDLRNALGAGVFGTYAEGGGMLLGLFVIGRFVFTVISPIGTGFASLVRLDLKYGSSGSLRDLSFLRISPGYLLLRLDALGLTGLGEFVCGLYVGGGGGNGLSGLSRENEDEDCISGRGKGDLTVVCALIGRCRSTGRSEGLFVDNAYLG